MKRNELHGICVHIVFLFSFHNLSNLCNDRIDMFGVARIWRRSYGGEFDAPK